ncbi:glycoside hydrolase family 88/105 protein [Anaeromicropila populeti]|uniref:Unsaturated rhamnogalacturonyl hydrolase n=1 Tax=Anaeromicropila populeti TaxID=37658 RepID=A0A1I6LU98_9FIRM|nr:glycoside hydrolase family 88 protein [Anaeromicropila populeti]SFS07047.1 unsaturated rhamnogalacturonyl hydrolase [Anaeromicropila populeti]
MEILERYIDELLEKSTPQAPVWNIEKIRSGAKPSWNYIDGAMIKAILELYDITREEKYLTFADNFIDYFVREDGTIDSYDPEEYNIDNVNAGKTLFELYKLTGKEKYRKAIDTIYGQIQKQPRTKEGNFWHKKIYPNQVWLDGLYMGQPFYMQYEVEFNNCKNCFDSYQQFLNVYRIMKDPKTGLYYHGYDSSKEMFWADKETGLSSNFWLRALGWYAMALVDTMSVMPDSMKEERDQLNEIYKQLIDSMIQYQDESGMWYQVVDKGGVEPNYLETSGSAIFAYAIMKSVREGFLPESYFQYGEKAFYGVADKYLSEENGQLQLGGICLVAGLGGPDNRDGSFAYYMSEPVVKNEAKGVAPLILAYIEILHKRQAEQ